VQHFDHQFTAMGGPCRIRLDCAVEADALEATAAAEAEVRRLERKYSRYLDDSLTSRINRAAGSGAATAIDAETAGLLHYADTLWQESGGLFDLTSGVLRQAWDFKSGQPPRQSKLDPLLSLVGWDRVRWGQDSVSLPVAGMQLDFGGCVKEYGADAAAAALRQSGISHGLVDLAGDMAAVGGQADGKPWQVGIRSPVEQGRAVAGVHLVTGGLASSGDYERCIEFGGRRYGHILDPRRGWPVEGLAAVSVAAPQCLVAGSSATMAMLMPQEEALAWLEELGLPWLAVDREQEVYGTLLALA
jgi:thiamine biosynthesis lipoprotein